MFTGCHGYVCLLVVIVFYSIVIYILTGCHGASVAGGGRGAQGQSWRRPEQVQAHISGPHLHADLW